MAKKALIDKELITQLINFIGGKDNVASVTHCLTRLRFALLSRQITL